jgi:hypothetical protein
MIFLPIVERELRAAARRRGTYRIRWWTALITMVVSAWFLVVVAPGGGRGNWLFSFLRDRATITSQIVAQGFWPLARRERRAYPASGSVRSEQRSQRAKDQARICEVIVARSLTWFELLLCLLAGVFFTADSLSEEKREGTLGLLFLTDLKGYDVVLGKLAATSVNAFYALLALLPVTALPLLMGGVTGEEFGRRALALVNALFISLATGLCVSIFARDGQRAMGATLGLVAALAGVLPGLAKLGALAHVPPGWLRLA